MVCRRTSFRICPDGALSSSTQLADADRAHCFHVGNSLPRRRRRAAPKRLLFDLTRTHGMESKLRTGLARTTIASIRPAVSDELALYDLRPDILSANDTFFMKPLATVIALSPADAPPCDQDRAPS